MLRDTVTVGYGSAGAHSLERALRLTAPTDTGSSISVTGVLLGLLFFFLYDNDKGETQSSKARQLNT
jgi:hypothetical protein